MDVASIGVVAVALFLAVAAALLRTWAAAAGSTSNQTRAAAYWMHLLALAILMRPMGAIFTAAAATAVCGALACLPPAEAPAPLGWLRALARELYFWGVALTYAIFATRYNTTLMEQGVLVSLGVGIIVRQLVQAPPQHATA